MLKYLLGFNVNNYYKTGEFHTKKKKNKIKSSMK